MGEAPPKFGVDPVDPRAPSQDAWDRMAAAQRAEVLDSLPSEFAVNEAAPPEGDTHFEAVDAWMCPWRQVLRPRRQQDVPMEARGCAHGGSRMCPWRHEDVPTEAGSAS